MKISRKEKRKSKITITKSIEEKLDKTDDSDRRKSPFLPKEKLGVENEINDLISSEDFFDDTIPTKKSEKEPKKSTNNKKKRKKEKTEHRNNSFGDFIVLLVTFVGFIGFIGFLWKILG